MIGLSPADPATSAGVTQHVLSSPVDQHPTTSTAPAPAIRAPRPRPAIRRQQNLALAFVLAGVAVSILFIVVTLVVMLHVPEVRHALATL